MKNLHITCDNLEQRQNVFDVLGLLGYKSDGNDYDETNIQTDSDLKEWMTWTIDCRLNNTTEITYTQFMEQYKMQALKNKITEATKHLNISQRQLSKDIGKSRNYLSEMVRNGCTTAKQKELIEMIDLVMRGEVFKSDGEVIAELTEKLSNAQDAVAELQAESDKYFKESDERFTQLCQQKDENTSLKIEKESILAVLGPEIHNLKSKLAEAQDLSANKVTENYKLNLDIDRLKKANIELMEESDKYHNANTELNAELNTMRKNAQEADTVLKNTQDDLDYIKAENNQLRKAVSDRDMLNESLNTENAELAEQLGFKTKAVYELQSKLKSERRWMIAFIILTLVLSGLLVWGV